MAADVHQQTLNTIIFLYKDYIQRYVQSVYVDPYEHFRSSALLFIIQINLQSQVRGYPLPKSYQCVNILNISHYNTLKTTWWKVIALKPSRRHFVSTGYEAGLGFTAIDLDSDCGLIHH